MKPNIYFFNPTCELAVVNGSNNYMASARLQRFENELSVLPWIFARREDIILTDRTPSLQFTDMLGNAGFTLPNFRRTESSLSDTSFLSCEKGFLFPWGWSPAAHKFLSPLKSRCSNEFLNSPVIEWREIHRELYSRESALKILKDIVECKISNNILNVNYLPVICTCHEQIIDLQRKWRRVVVKSPWSSSGRGLQVLRPNEYNQTNKQVITGYLKQQGYVVVEPWHEKVLDISFQFFSYGNGVIEYRGLTSFSTDHSGHYAGNYIQEIPSDLAPEIKEFLNQNIPEVLQALQRTLTKSDYSTEYYGWIGVDALIWKSAEEKLIIHPCIEINCRLTMGAIVLSLRSHLAGQSTGEFQIMHGKEGDFAQFCEKMMANEPLIVDSGKIVSGFLPVTRMLPDSFFGAWINVRNERRKVDWLIG